MDELLPWCVAHGTGVLCYSPMQSGLLTGSFSRQRAAGLPSDDWRRRDPEFQEPRLSANLAQERRLGPVAARHGTTVATVAVAWVLAQAGVTAAIAGARRAAQVDGWIGAGDLALTPRTSPTWKGRGPAPHRAPRRTPPPAPHRHPGPRGHDGGGLPAGHDRNPVAG